ncbi:MAG: fused MFS/spermidine synthase [Proteobacteria bacterium]|nr:fused MFS/spermidine synthase [Pseudomonadota bacterium]
MRANQGYKEFLLGLTVFMTAAAALAVEIVAARIMAPIVGMSLYTWTAVIAVVLAGLSIGHWAAGRLLGEASASGRGAAVIAASLALAGLSTVGAAFLRGLAGDMLGALGGVGIASTAALATLLFFAPSFFAGIVAPAATALAISPEGVDRGRVIGRMFALGAAGSILGTLTAGYVLLSWIGSFDSLLLIAGVYGVLAILHWIFMSRRA